MNQFKNIITFTLFDSSKWSLSNLVYLFKIYISKFARGQVFIVFLSWSISLSFMKFETVW